MGGGCGPTAKAELSQDVAELAATNLNVGNDSFALFGGGNAAGFISDSTNKVDVFDGSNGLFRETLEFEGRARRSLAATTIRCNNSAFALFGGGYGLPTSNSTGEQSLDDVDIFVCNDTENVYRLPVTYFQGEPRNSLAATGATCGNTSYALFGGGLNRGFLISNYSNDVDIFTCNDEMAYWNDKTEFRKAPRLNLAATSAVNNSGDAFFVFAGGETPFKSPDNFSNDVDIFTCNGSSGVTYHMNDELRGAPRSKLAATTVSNSTESYLIFAGGLSGLSTPNDDVDIYKCNDDGIFYDRLEQFSGKPRAFMGATSVTCGNDMYALFGGGADQFGMGTSSVVNDVDIYKCNDDGLFYMGVTYFTGEARCGPAATTVNCSGTDYGLFGGGQTAGFLPTRFNTVDIYSCETEGFLPQ